MNQRSKHLVLLALSDGNKNSIEIQNLANSTKLPYSEPENALSLTNSECPVSPSNLEDPTTTTPEQDDTTFENPGLDLVQDRFHPVAPVAVLPVAPVVVPVILLQKTIIRIMRV
ncbi:hypothetical protein HF086_005379 [Spodoptera exigua]|uniref:Uncharacterized protein n=1 Tax=Spodoptera exigua TaxID=7107 RepID=A0A922SIA2_SPOEX|nr:hypothetical protein HF086_005379 [Spodoptera exigua]